MRLISDLKSYTGRTFQADVLAGLTVAVILVPQGMAYSMLAGLPPIYGLYAGLVPMLVYPWFASSRTLSVGPVALMSILLLSSLTLFAVPGSEEYLQLVLLTALLAGIIQVLLGVFKLGFLSNFLSRPVMTGFVSAAGVIIAISQIKYLFTLEVPRSSSIIQILHDDYLALGSGNRYSLILGVSSFVLLILMKRWIPKFPRYLLVVVLGTLILYFTSMESMGVPIIGELKQGLPWFNASFLSFDNVINLFPSALVISLICFVGSYSIAETVGNSAPGSVSANKELIGLGMAKIAGSFFLSMPSTGSFTRSAVNAEAGAQTGMASIICAFFIGLTLLFFAPLFYYLPEPVLAAIVLASVTSLIKWKEAQRLWNFDRRDFWIMVITFLLTLTLGIVNGILSGIVLSLLAIIQRSSKPHFAELGRLPGTTSYRNIKRYPETIIDPQSLVLRYDQDLFFGNAGHFYRSLIHKLKERQPTHLVLHLGAIHHMDSTAILRLKDFIKYCQMENIALTFTNLSGPIRDLFERAELFTMIGRDHVHLNVAHALLRNLEESNIDKDLSRKYARQNDKAERQ